GHIRPRNPPPGVPKAALRGPGRWQRTERWGEADREESVKGCLRSDVGRLQRHHNTSETTELTTMTDGIRCTCLCYYPTVSCSHIPFRQFRPGDEAEFGDLAHLVDVDAEIRTSADQAVGIRGREAVLLHQPLDQHHSRRLHRHLQGSIDVD